MTSTLARYVPCFHVSGSLVKAALAKDTLAKFKDTVTGIHLTAKPYQCDVARNMAYNTSLLRFAPRIFRATFSASDCKRYISAYPYARVKP
jgi:hypothetical protein